MDRRRVEGFPIDAPSARDVQGHEVIQGEEGFATSVWPKDGKLEEDEVALFVLALENWIYDSHLAAGIQIWWVNPHGTVST